MTSSNSPIPDLSVPQLPKPHLSFTQDGKAQASTKLPELGRAGPSKKPISEGKKREDAIPELDDRPYERELSKREKAAVSNHYKKTVILALRLSTC